MIEIFNRVKDLVEGSHLLRACFRFARDLRREVNSTLVEVPFFIRENGRLNFDVAPLIFDEAGR